MAFRIIFFGTPSFALPSLETLLGDPRLSVIAVVTQPARPQGRGLSMSETKVAAFARARNLAVFDSLSSLQELRADLGVCVAYGGILPASVLSLPRLGILNLHPSLLPTYRGASPIQEAILNGDRETGVTIIRMTEVLDSGPLVAQERIAITPLDTAEILNERLANVGATLFLHIIPDYMAGRIAPVPQDDTKASFCRKITRDSSHIVWENVSAEALLRRLRAFTPWPGLATFISGKRLKILAATTAPAQRKALPGTIEIDAGVLSIHTTDDLFQPKLIQWEGKNPLPIADFLRGYAEKLPRCLA